LPSTSATSMSPPAVSQSTEPETFPSRAMSPPVVSTSTIPLISVVTVISPPVLSASILNSVGTPISNTRVSFMRMLSSGSNLTSTPSAVWLMLSHLDHSSCIPFTLTVTLPAAPLITISAPTTSTIRLPPGDTVNDSETTAYWAAVSPWVKQISSTADTKIITLFFNISPPPGLL